MFGCCVLRNISPDEFAKNHQSRHPGEPRIESGAGAGVQKSLSFLDSGFRRNDRKGRFVTSYEFINPDDPVNPVNIFLFFLLLQAPWSPVRGVFTCKLQ